MPSVNSKILQADYNSIRSKIVAVFGTGSSDRGYGQVVQSQPVSVSSKVSINDWANLRFDIINAYRHINGISPILAEVFENNIIRYTNSFTPDTGSLDVPQFQYDTWANDIDTNRFTIDPGAAGTTAVVSSSRTGPWQSECTCLITFNWTNAEQARYWFNSGGRIRISASRGPDGAATAQNQDWTDLLFAAGTIEFGGAVPSAGTVPNNGANWYRTTQNFQPYSTISGTTAYASNQYLLEARCVGVASNSAGTAAQGEIRVRFRDLYTDPDLDAGDSSLTNPPGDVVDGTLTVSVSTQFAAATPLVPGSGLFTVEQPVIAVGAVLGS